MELTDTSPRPVIPAKAGIHNDVEVTRITKIPWIPAFDGVTGERTAVQNITIKPWIPAFTGMTGEQTAVHSTENAVQALGKPCSLAI